MLIEYIRNKQNQPVGCFIAKKSYNDEKRVIIGWSKFAESKEKKAFSKERAKDICEVRINIAEQKNGEHRSRKNRPFLVQEKLDSFMNRCERYYKTKKFVIV